MNKKYFAFFSSLKAGKVPHYWLSGRGKIGQGKWVISEINQTEGHIKTCGNCQKSRLVEIPHDFFLITPGDSILFLINPWTFRMLFLQYPWRFHILLTGAVWSFSGIAKFR